MDTRAPSTRPRRVARDRSASGRVAFAAALCDVVADPTNDITGVRLVSATPDTADAVEEVALQRGLAAHGDASAHGGAPANRATRSVTIRPEWPHPTRRSA